MFSWLVFVNQKLVLLYRLYGQPTVDHPKKLTG
ncbi:hypothetical protein Pan181_20840 [Aeoliella mucimassa]|uniref:Uncharacterized protein n=1 Tax=Aeoliella mucimassa TaxID=2527972 RepID=A0A518AMD9_9BACT|nr:hypothetical protein Pan181_20840 [Aeoliella mucimassa]